jgi:hypothetical protein
MPYKDPEVAKQKAHEYYLKNKERILERSKEYVETHREEHRATCIRWNERNKEKMDEYSLLHARYRSHHRRLGAHLHGVRTEKFIDGPRQIPDEAPVRCSVGLADRMDDIGQCRRDFLRDVDILDLALGVDGFEVVVETGESQRQRLDEFRGIGSLQSNRGGSCGAGIRGSGRCCRWRQVSSPPR